MTNPGSIEAARRGWRAPCADCRATSGVHQVWRKDGTMVFLCGSCEYLRIHPDAPRAVKLPRERSKRLQKETLF